MNPVAISTAATLLYFSDCLWPDFDEQCLCQALEWYYRRERRFGDIRP